MPSRRPGLTLVELLVVIGIVTVLIRMLMPALGRGRRHARAVVCLANLRQLALGFDEYVRQNRGRPPVFGEGPEGWFHLVRGKLTEASPRLVCPEATETTGVSESEDGGMCVGTAVHAWGWKETPEWPLLLPEQYGEFIRDLGSYCFNAWVLRPRRVPMSPLTPPDHFHGPQPRQVPRVPLLGDGVYYWAIPKHDDPPPANLLAPCATRFPPSYEPINGGLRRFCIARHGRAVNMVFLDGHAETVELTELWRLRWNAQFIPTQVTLPSR